MVKLVPGFPCLRLGSEGGVLMVLELMVCCPLVVVEVPFLVTMFLLGGSLVVLLTGSPWLETSSVRPCQAGWCEAVGSLGGGVGWEQISQGSVGGEQVA